MCAVRWSWKSSKCMYFICACVSFSSFIEFFFVMSSFEFFSFFKAFHLHDVAIDIDFFVLFKFLHFFSLSLRFFLYFLKYEIWLRNKSQKLKVRILSIINKNIFDCMHSSIFVNLSKKLVEKLIFKINYHVNYFSIHV